MTERDPHPAEELTPAQAEAVRRLLAGARHDDGIPDDVAARLDAVIADLAAQRGEAPATSEPTREADVIPLRRRRWPQVLVAAAAVTVFGFGTVQIVGNSANDDDAGGGATAERDAPAAVTDGRDDNEPEAGPPESAPLPSGDALSQNLSMLSQQSLSRLGIEGLSVLRRGTLDSDLKELLPTEAQTRTDAPRDLAAYAARGCGPYYTVSGGETFAASYRRHVALVLFHPALDGARLVEIYDCESKTPRQTVRSVTLQTGE